MTVAQLADLTGRCYRAVFNALSRGYALGILTRQEENGIGRGRRFWYSLADDWEQRAALASVDMRTFGAGLARAANAAIGLQMHADRLLNPDRTEGPTLDVAQRETLRAWSKIANYEYKGLCQIADAAERLDKATIKATIAGAGDGNWRALQAARRFNATILIGEELSPRQAERLFRHWAALHGYYELARQDNTTRRQREAALKTVRVKRPADLPPPPVERAAIVAQPMVWRQTLLAEYMLDGCD